MKSDVKNFEIVANNCWGGEVYKTFKKEYNTPFVGLFIPPDDFIKLLSRFNENVHSQLVFIKESKYLIYNSKREKLNKFYPIGLLNGIIEIHFEHYKSEEEALLKWTRRLARMSLTESNMFFKFCDRDGCTMSHLKSFDQIALKNKICFTSKYYSGLNSIFIIENRNAESVVDGKSLFLVSINYFDLSRWLDDGVAQLAFNQMYPLLSRLIKIEWIQVKKRIKNILS